MAGIINKARSLAPLTPTKPLKPLKSPTFEEMNPGFQAPTAPTGVGNAAPAVRANPVNVPTFEEMNPGFQAPTAPTGVGNAAPAVRAIPVSVTPSPGTTPPMSAAGAGIIDSTLRTTTPAGPPEDSAPGTVTPQYVAPPPTSGPVPPKPAVTPPVMEETQEVTSLDKTSRLEEAERAVQRPGPPGPQSGQVTAQNPEGLPTYIDEQGRERFDFSGSNSQQQQTQWAGWLTNVGQTNPELRGQKVNVLEMFKQGGSGIAPHPDYVTPVGDGFTGTRNGSNYVNGHLFAPAPHAGDPAWEQYWTRYIPTGPGDTGEADFSPERPPGYVDPAPNNPATRGPRGATPGTPPLPPGSNPARRPGVTPPGTTPPGTTPPGTTPGSTAPAVSWTPTSGIIDRIRGIDPAMVEGTGYNPTAVGETERATAGGYEGQGYTAQQAPEAQGFDAEGYEAGQVDENVSDATGRIMSKDSEVLQRARAMAGQQANARGILNTTMGVQAGQAAVLDRALEMAYGDVDVAKFNVAQKNEASAFLANWKNQAAQFKAAEQNQNGRFNAEQANAAAAFTANAKNTAAQFTAAAENTARIFNAGEANKAALFAVEQANLASRFAAEAENAARSQNATAYNQAMQRFADAQNAAIAAQNDAENLARRDTAQIAASRQENEARIAGSLEQSRLGSNTALEQTRMTTTAQRDMQERSITAEMERLGLQLSAEEQRFVRNMSANQFNAYQQGLNAGMLVEMEPEARQNWLFNYNSVWMASGNLPFDIDMSQFPPAGGATTSPNNNGNNQNTNTNTNRNPAGR